MRDQFSEAFFLNTVLDVNFKGLDENDQIAFLYDKII